MHSRAAAEEESQPGRGRPGGRHVIRVDGRAAPLAPALRHERHVGRRQQPQVAVDRPAAHAKMCRKGVDSVAGRFQEPQTFNYPDGPPVRAAGSAARHSGPLSARASSIVRRSGKAPSVLAARCDRNLSLVAAHRGSAVGLLPGRGAPIRSNTIGYAGKGGKSPEKTRGPPHGGIAGGLPQFETGHLYYSAYEAACQPDWSASGENIIFPVENEGSTGKTLGFGPDSKGIRRRQIPAGGF